MSNSLGGVNSAYFSNNERRICFLVSGEVARDKSLREEADDRDPINVLSGMKNRQGLPDQPKVMTKALSSLLPRSFRPIGQEIWIDTFQKKSSGRFYV